MSLQRTMYVKTGRRPQKPYQILLKNVVTSFKLFLKETGLHGLKYVGDSSMSTWERIFFFCAFTTALYTTVHLISNIYGKWDSTPVIIGISPHATSILKVPFPAITVCNMNQALRSKVSDFPEGSFEKAILKILCKEETEFDEQMQNSEIFKNNNVNMADFVKNHSQPCSKLLLSCKYSMTFYNCSHLFQEIITDEGLCCVFNMLPPKFLYKTLKTENVIETGGFVPVKWNLEKGYPTEMPRKYYPRPGAGTGVSLGFSIILDAQIDEYYCSSSFGPGFKLYFHNPIETPTVKESGLIVPVGHESRFRVEMMRSDAVASIRSVQRLRRQCIFDDEVSLLYFKHYTRRNCEFECTAKNLYEVCGCIPYNLPQVYSNASVCGAKDMFCIIHTQSTRTEIANSKCHVRCLPSCFDLNYSADLFTSLLGGETYDITSTYLKNLSRTYMKKNIAVVHTYYRESVYYGDLKNVYVGFTDFLSNIGGVMGLFIGFSFISIAEMFYFILLRPIVEFFKARKQIQAEAQIFHTSQSNKVWYTNELYRMDFQQKTNENRDVKKCWL